MNRSLIELLVVCLILSFAPQVPAKTAYIDNLRITVRRGPEIDYRIIAFLNPGDQVDVLEKSETGWYKIKLPNGQTGWLIGRYLTEEPPAQVRVKRLREENQELTAEVARMEETNNRLKESLAESRRRQIGLASLDGSGQATSVEELAAATHQAKVILDEEEETLTALKAKLGNQNNLIQWFLIGAGVTGLGIIIGLLTAGWRRAVSRRSQKGELKSWS